MHRDSMEGGGRRANLMERRHTHIVWKEIRKKEKKVHILFFKKIY